MSDQPLTLINRRGEPLPVDFFKAAGDFGHTVFVGVSGKGKSLVSRRVLSDAQLAYVAQCTLTQQPAECEILALRPLGLPEEVAFHHAAMLMSAGFILNPHSRQWMWERVVPGTSVKHQLCYMGLIAGAEWIPDGMWLKACSTDLLTDRPSKHANALEALDTSFDGDGIDHLAAILQGCLRNELLWHQGGFTDFDPEW